MKCRVLSENADSTVQPCPGAYKKEMQIDKRQVTLWFLDFGSLEAFREFVGKYPRVSVSREPRRWHLNLLIQA